MVTDTHTHTHTHHVSKMNREWYRVGRRTPSILISNGLTSQCRTYYIENMNVSLVLVFVAEGGGWAFLCHNILTVTLIVVFFFCTIAIDSEWHSHIENRTTINRVFAEEKKNNNEREKIGFRPERTRHSSSVGMMRIVVFSSLTGRQYEIEMFKWLKG